MTLKSANINALWGKLLIEELVRHDITRFYISPGSRSTPLTIAAAENQSTNCNICLDERAAAFRALGFSRATGRPAVLICSSGTAGANYFPAIIEASVDRIPMIIITADRPPELRETAANQTIRQIPFYSGHTRWQFDMPCPTIEIPAQFILTTAAQIVSRSLSPEPGPVHLNCMFREPLAPLDKPVSPEYIKPVSNWYSSSIPFTELNLPLQNLTKTAQKKIYDYLSAPSGILSVGRLRSQNEAKAVEQLAIKSNWLLATDISSGLRFSDSFPNMLRYHDQLLLSSSFADALPKRILHIGDPPLSKRWLKQMNRDDTELAC
ncbi:MAG: 2-succinyl-5-enolpyruvyl-6-hydroxy-3-cyclohexene-1-carboxylic-acid synthase, partial [Calditrichota bacterium]